MNKAASCSFVKHLKYFFLKFMLLEIYIHTKMQTHIYVSPQFLRQITLLCNSLISVITKFTQTCPFKIWDARKLLPSCLSLQKKIPSMTFILEIYFFSQNINGLHSHI